MLHILFSVPILRCLLRAALSRTDRPVQGLFVKLAQLIARSLGVTGTRSVARPRRAESPYRIRRPNFLQG